MKIKTFIILGTIIAVCIIAGLAFFYLHAKGSPNPDQDYLDIIQGNPPDDYIDRLEALILNHPDPYIRENGIITLTEIALRKNETEKISGFLKNLAMNATDESDRMAADSSYGMLRSERPLPVQAEMNILIEDRIRKNTPVTILVDFRPKVANKDVRIYIPSLDSSINLVSDQTIRFTAIANRPQRVKFTINLTEDGKYVIPVEYMMSFDRIDYEKVRKRVFLTVNQTGGSYFIV